MVNCHVCCCSNVRGCCFNIAINPKNVGKVKPIDVIGPEFVFPIVSDLEKWHKRSSQTAHPTFGMVGTEFMFLLIFIYFSQHSYETDMALTWLENSHEVEWGSTIKLLVFCVYIYCVLLQFYFLHNVIVAMFLVCGFDRVRYREGRDGSRAWCHAALLIIIIIIITTEIQIGRQLQTTVLVFVISPPPRSGTVTASWRPGWTWNSWWRSWGWARPTFHPAAPSLRSKVRLRLAGVHLLHVCCCCCCYWHRSCEVYSCICQCGS